MAFEFFRYYMFGPTSPWLAVVPRTIRNQMGTLIDPYIAWERASAIVDMWQEGSVEISSASGDWQVTSHMSSLYMYVAVT